MDLLEIIIVVAMIVLMARIASADDQSPWLWGGSDLRALCGRHRTVSYTLAAVETELLMTSSAVTSAPRWSER